MRCPNYRDCVSSVQGCLLAMRINDVRNRINNRSSSVPASAVPDNSTKGKLCRTLNGKAIIGVWGRDMVNNEKPRKGKTPVGVNEMRMRWM